MAEKPPKKPFLGDEDLASELDAWDATFDALHEEPAEGALGTEPVMEWPVGAPTQPSVPPVRIPEPPDAAHTFEDLAVNFDEAHALEPAEQPRKRERPSTRPPGGWPSDADETDFSELGARQQPEALGEMLGASVDDDIEVEEDQVYTSASRPNVRAAPDALPLPDDPIAPPPVAVPRVRTGPAIIRRSQPSIAVPKVTPVGMPSQPAHDPFGESTRIADYKEIEASRNEARRADARSKAPTAPPPFSMTAMPEPAEEDFPDIEIGADAPDVPPTVPELPRTRPADPLAPRRTVAHVVRRETPAKGAPMPVARKPSPVVEIDIPDPSPATEDDFSDVAAAVGAHGEPVLDDPPNRATPRGGLIHEIGPSTEELLDDHSPTTSIEIDDVEEELAIGHEDAYVPMGPAEDLEIPHDLPSIPEPASRRPPSLMDLYPRVKTPTSVPPLGEMPDIRRAPHPSEEREEEEPAAEIVTPEAVPRTRLATPMPVFDDDGREVEPVLDLDALGADKPWPEQVQPLPSSQLDEESAGALLIYEREIATVDDSTASAALRIEAGRLCERLGDLERARSHYDAALLADPRATAALRGLRRLARQSSDLGEATRMLDAEIAVAGALERRPLGHYRIDLLLASGEQDLARVAVGELLDSARSDVRALLAQLELAFLDGRADEFGSALEQLAHAVTDNELRAAAQSARAVLAAHHNDTAGAATWFAAAAEADPGAIAAWLGAIRQAAAQNDGQAAAHALLDLAHQVEATDPLTAAALALRAQHWAAGSGEAAGQLATTLMPSEPLVARLAAESANLVADPVGAGTIYAAWAGTQAHPAERSFAAARAAELDPGRAAELWTLALEQDGGDDYGAAQLRTAYVAGEATQLAIDVDLAVATDTERDRARLRAAFGLIGQGQLEGAIQLLEEGHAARPKSLALTEALAEALAAAGRWSDRAQLLAKLAADPGDQLDKAVAQLRSALAYEEAVGAASEAGEDNHDEVQRTTAAALAAWEKVLEHSPDAPAAHAASIVLASRLGDSDVLGEVLARTQAAERSPWGVASMALRRARLIASEDPGRAEQLLRDASPELDDPRRTAWLVLAAARRKELDDAATALEDRAKQLGDVPEASALRLRAAQLALDAGQAPRATTLLGQVARALPTLGIVPDLLAAARRRSGDRSGPIARIDHAAASGAAAGDAFARIVRDADLSAAQGDGSAALAMYQRALEIRPGDPLATVPLIRVATSVREPAPIAALALAQLRASEAAGDHAAKAEAYELLAHIDKELRGDAGSAQIALESAAQADPTRIDVMHRLEREYAASDQLGELLRLRRAELDQIPADLPKDRAAMIMDTAGLAERDQRADVELSELYRSALAADSKHRLALLHLESIVRRAGGSEELATLEEQIAGYFEGDARSQAAFFTRAGETLGELGQIDGAVQRFGKADEVLPGHVPALEGWRAAALKGQLWLDVATAANRQAAVADDADSRASLYHFAGVVLMDKALIADQATTAFRRALDADPAHRDAFLRLRILLEEDANHDELAVVLRNRLEHETDDKTKIEIHRALADLCRNFLSDRDSALEHYKAVLAADPADLRAHAAIADIAWELGNWQDAADALIARAKLERDPETLKNLCHRLGLIYADRLVDVPMALKAFQRALTYQPDDEATLIRLADLATQAGEWKLALGACERLVKSAADPDKRATHLHRVAKIFRQGFGDHKRAERALNLALDGAPTNDEALAELVKFYRESGDMTSVRVHLNRVAGAMRVRIAHDPKDGVAYRVIARAMAARAAASVDGSFPIARAAAEMAQLLGAADDPERVVLAEPMRIDVAPLLRSEADEVLFGRGIQTELRQLFTLLGDRVAKHVGVDLRVYGVGRGDRLRARDGGVAAHAQDVATGLGFGEIDVYVSTRQPYAMVAEPTSPVSLVIGQTIAQGDSKGVRFAAGAALKLAQTSMAIPARLPADDLGVLVVALIRLFQPDFPGKGLDEAAITAQAQKLRRLIPSGLMSDLRPYALAIDAGAFVPTELARDLKIAGLRAGLVASGSILAGFGLLAAQAGTDVPSFLTDPLAQGVLSFALGEDHATVAR